jgi:hypothetical protein
VGKNHVLAPGGTFRQSAYLQETALLLGQGHVYAESAALLERLCGVSLSDKQIENLCHHYGQILETHPQPEALTLHQSEQLCYAMVDGCFIQSREQGWTETKLGRVFSAHQLMARSAKRNFIHASDYVAHVGGHEAFCAKLSPLLDSQRQLVVVADGAPWLWNWTDTMYPNAVQILDFYHAYEHICQWAVLALKEADQRSQWCEQAKSWLLNDEVDEVIDCLNSLVYQGDVAKKQTNLLTYLATHKHRMRYKTYQRQGYLIGLGPIESAHRTVIQHRLKRSGQRWTLGGSQQVLNLRTARLSNRWEKVVELVKKDT